MSAPVYGAIIGPLINEPYHVPGEATVYTAPFRVDVFESVEMDVRWRVNRPGSLRNLMVEVVGTQPNDGDLKITVRWSFSDTPITVTIPAGTTTPTGIIFNDAEHVQGHSTGEDVMFMIENESASPSIGIRVINLGVDQPIVE